MTTPIATLPPRWVEAVPAKAKLITVESSGYELPEVVGSGQRYAAVRDYTASRFMKRLSKDEIWALVKSEVAPRLDPQKTEAALRADFERAWKGTERRLGEPPLTEPMSSEEVADSGIGMDAADLLEMDLPPLRMIVPGLLPEGTAILAAPPKVGKSCLVYQFAVEIAVGGEMFGQTVATGSVLYLALEDGKRRGQDRLRAALDGRRMPRGRLEIRWGARKLGEGLEGDLTAWLDAHPDAAFVAIDTLGRVRPASNGKRNAYEVDVEDIGRLQNIFRDRPVGLLLVHHTNKASSGKDDFVASVSGTYGVSGSVDTTLVIKRERLKDDGSIVVTGREIKEGELSVTFDGKLWSEAPGVLTKASFERQEVYDYLAENGPMHALAVADGLGKERPNIQVMMMSMTENGDLERVGDGYAVGRKDAWERGRS